VSGHGTDSAGCGGPTSPCRTLQYAHDNIVLANGEIDILDPAGYGAVTITKALSIVNDGVGTAGVQQANASSAAITINAGTSDAIYLRGLNIDGLGTGHDGIVFNSGGSLAVANCVVRHFKYNGIYIQPNSNTALLSISNTTASDNGYIGIFMEPKGSASVKGTIAGVEVSRNADGIGIQGVSSTGTATYVLVSDANVGNNTDYGFFAQGSVKLAITRSTATGNQSGVYVAGTIYTYGDNRIAGNVYDVVGVLTAATGS
jgi:hypothetical protein